MPLIEIDNDYLIEITIKEVLTKDFREIIADFQRLESKKELYQGKIDLLFRGYENDNREMAGIPEILEWLRHAFHQCDGWLYYLNLDPNSGYSIRNLIFSLVDHKEVYIDDRTSNIIIEDADIERQFVLPALANLREFNKRNLVDENTEIKIINYLNEFLRFHFYE